jgi:hypothetical protein
MSMDYELELTRLLDAIRKEWPGAKVRGAVGATCREDGTRYISYAGWCEDSFGHGYDIDGCMKELRWSVERIQAKLLSAQEYADFRQWKAERAAQAAKGK